MKTVSQPQISAYYDTSKSNTSSVKQSRGNLKLANRSGNTQSHYGSM